jgi:hypothetical protein
MSRKPSIFVPLLLVALGTLWLLSNIGAIPSSNLRVLIPLWPVLIIALGLGIVLRQRWTLAWNIVSLLLVTLMVLAVIFAPQLGLTNVSGNLSWFPNVQLSGNVITEERVASGFSAISISYPAEVIIQQGSEEKLTLVGDENLLRYLRTSVKGKTLEIESVPGIRFNWNISGSQVRIEITVKDLNEIGFSSAGRVELTGLKTSSLKLRISGAGDVILSDLDLESLNSSISGAGRIEADGVAKQITINISGFGDYKGEELQSQTAEVHISGAGSADVWAVETLDAVISGAGSVNYIGSPTVKQSISGAGSIKQISK